MKNFQDFSVPFSLSNFNTRLKKVMSTGICIAADLNDNIEKLHKVFQAS